MNEKFLKYKKINCRYCDKKLGKPFLDLGLQPLANAFIKQGEDPQEEFRCPLGLVLCGNCKLTQLTHVVPPEKMFANYLYVSSTTATFREHFAAYAREIKERLITKENLPVAVDIGSNDGLLVSCYAKEGMRAVGIEPAKNLSDEANHENIPTINKCFDEISVGEVLEKYGKADVVSGNNVFAHIDDVRCFCQNVGQLLKDTGIFVIEFPYLLTMLEKLLFDMIYHEHLSYISLHPLAKLLNHHDLQIFDVSYVSTHGGSCRVYIQKVGGPYAMSDAVDNMLGIELSQGFHTAQVYENFAKRVYKAKQDLCEFMDRSLKENKTVSGYGAPAKASTLINFCQFTPSQIQYLIDDNPLKQNTVVPGSRIPVYGSAHLKNNPTNYVILFAWNFAKEIIKKIGYLSKENGVQFLLPLDLDSPLKADMWHFSCMF